MRTDEIRLKNVFNIIDTRCGGVKAEFGRRINMVPQTIAKWWATGASSRNIGTNAARKIEIAFDLPEGWLDVLHTDNSDLEQDPYKKQQLKIASGNTHKISLKKRAIIEQQQLRLTLLNEDIKGDVMLLSTDKDAWSIQLVGTHPNPILNQGWGIIVEPNTPITANEYTLVTRKNGELLLRVLAHQDTNEIILTNPITSEQIRLPWEDIDKAEYCYIGIPPSKIITNKQETP